jgi:hypothetical protein
MAPSLCDTATRIKDGLERGGRGGGGLISRDVSNRLGERGPGSPRGCGDGGVGWKERMVWAEWRVLRSALVSVLIAAIAHE